MTHVVTRYGIEIDCSFEHKTGCPRCIKRGHDNSRNNFHVYGQDSDGRHKGGHCFSCEFTIPSEEWLEENGDHAVENEEGFEYVGSAFTDEIHDKLKASLTTNSSNWRNVSAATCAYFGVRHEYSTETGTLVAQYYPCTQPTESGSGSGFEVSGYKRRILPKDFSQPIGETGKDCHMFGQFRFLKSNSKTVVVVGGEVDQLSAFQMLKEYADAKGGDYEPTPVVSSTVGEGGTYKQIQSQYEWFSRFEKIILCLDSDDAGQKAMEKIVKVLPKGKVYVMSMSMKDPNEYLKAGRNREFISAYFSAKPHAPSGIVGSGSLMDAIKEAAGREKIPLPPFMHELQKLMAGGIPLGVIVNLGSASGTGKSTISDELVYHWIFNSPHQIGIVSLEADTGQYGTNILSRHLGNKLNLIEDEAYKLALLNSPEVEAAGRELFFREDGSHRFWLVDDRDGGLDDLKDQIMKLIIQCECKVIILDPLQDVLDGLSNEEQAVFLRWMKGLLKSHGVTFILINHVRKSSGGGKQNSEGADIHEEDFQGSSSIFKSAACNLLFRRNKEAESEIERNTTLMKCTKCRWTGRTAPIVGRYFYENATHLMHDLNEYMRRHPEMMGD
jgi:archaellum biogenesis ATPase FlaH